MLERAGLAPRTVGTIFWRSSLGAVKVDTFGLGLLLGCQHVLLDVVGQSQCGALSDTNMGVSASRPIVAFPRAAIISAEFVVQTRWVPVGATIDSAFDFALKMVIAYFQPSRTFVLVFTSLVSGRWSS